MWFHGAFTFSGQNSTTSKRAILHNARICAYSHVCTESGYLDHHTTAMNDTRRKRWHRSWWKGPKETSLVSRSGQLLRRLRRRTSHQLRATLARSHMKHGGWRCQCQGCRSGDDLSRGCSLVTLRDLVLIGGAGALALPAAQASFAATRMSPRGVRGLPWRAPRACLAEAETGRHASRKLGSTKPTPATPWPPCPSGDPIAPGCQKLFGPYGGASALLG